MWEYHHGTKRQRRKIHQRHQKIEGRIKGHKEKDLVSLFEKRFYELEKKIDTSVEEMKRSGEVFKHDKRKLRRDRQIDAENDVPRIEKSQGGNKK